MLERLPDGAQILIRPIRADDKRFLEDGLRQLSDESVHRRFLSPKRSAITWPWPPNIPVNRFAA